MRVRQVVDGYFVCRGRHGCSEQEDWIQSSRCGSFILDVHKPQNSPQQESSDKFESRGKVYDGAYSCVMLTIA